jgi:hypothetical protein
VTDQPTDAQGAADMIAGLDDTSPDNIYRATYKWDMRGVAAAAASAAAGPAGGFQVATTHITATEILDLANNQPIVVSAPDDQTIILPTIALLSYRAGSTIYSWAPPFGIRWANQPSSLFIQGGPIPIDNLVDSHTVTLATPSGVSGLTNDPIISVQGQALVFSAETPEFATFDEPYGDGTIDVTVYYIAIEIPPA